MVAQSRRRDQLPPRSIGQHGRPGDGGSDHRLQFVRVGMLERIGDQYPLLVGRRRRGQLADQRFDPLMRGLGRRYHQPASLTIDRHRAGG